MGLRGKTLGIWAALLAVGFAAASPFLTKSLVGTGEAYNYSLAVGDAVEQMRHGDMPPLVGQTELAFNGRIHPLRNAPYLFYLAASVDAVTLHRLKPWQLQNVSLVLSLVGAVLTCYAGLRWATGCSQVTAFLLASVYGLSPPILCAANQLDLFMTVHAALFVPVATAACIRGCRQPSFSADAWLAAGLAAAWLAHPPVAVWLTFCLVAVRLVHFIMRPSWQVLASGACAAVLAALLACFVFVSVGTLNSDLGFFGAAGLFRPFVDALLNGVRNGFASSILPVSRTATATGDLQYGYVPWILTLGGTWAAFRRRRREVDATGLIVLGAACFVLILMAPVPVLTRLLWDMVPASVLTLTTEWPMQRLYLVALGLGLFGSALVVPKSLNAWRRPRWLLPLLIGLGAAWTGYQAEAFIRLGFANRRSMEETAVFYSPANLNLTVTSYAFLGLPPTYNHGVVDPAMEFRILQDGKDEVVSNLSAAFSGAPIVGQGPITVLRGTTRTAESKPIVLLPGHRYLISFSFKLPPSKGYLSFIGSGLKRFYGLPESGQRLGFGMLDGQRKTLPIWTDSAKPEKVVVGISIEPGEKVPAGLSDFADYSLQDVDMKALPVRLQGFLPLRFTVDQPFTESTVETPRRFLSGYRATVNGLDVTPLMSAARQVMVPIPAGHSVVELRYEGPKVVRVAFWVCAASWLVFWLWRLLGSPLPSNAFPRAVDLARRALGFASDHGALLAAALVASAFLAFSEAQRRRDRENIAAVGPVRIDFKLPYRQLGINQPILTTGKPGAGVILFANIVDGEHIRIGADVWGSLYQSELLPLDFFKMQTLVISDGALFPVGNPAVKALNEDDRNQLRGELRVELNGKVVIQVKCNTYESTPGEIHVGHASMGSTTGPDFLGEIVGFRRLDIPRTTTLPTNEHISMTVHFPRMAEGKREPILSVVCGGQRLTGYVAQLGGGLGQLITRDNSGYESASEALDLSRSPEHQLEVEPEGAGVAGAHFCLSVRLDGKQVLGHPKPPTPAAPSLIFTGLDQNATPGVDVRFMGLISPPILVPNSDSSPNAVPMSELHIVIRLPKGKLGRHEPLLTTGHTGAGDLIYLVYEDAGHIRVGVDHWGGYGGLSDPIPIDYGLPHEMWLRSGALYPQSVTDPAWHGKTPLQQRELTSKIEVVIDGKTVFVAPTSAHPTAPSEVTVGQNNIGMSTADAGFSGRIDFSERTSLQPPVN